MPQNDPPDSDEADLIKRAVAMDVESLYAQLGQLVFTGTVRKSRDELLLIGRHWVGEQWEKARTAICPHRDSISATGDAAATTTAILPYVGGSASGTAGILFAAVIAKVGVEMLCRGSEGPSDDSAGVA